MKKVISTAVVLVLFAISAAASYGYFEEAPVISYSGEWTGTTVEVTITPPSNKQLEEGDVIRYRLLNELVTNGDSGEPWLDYAAPLQIDKNTYIEAKVFFAAGGNTASAFSQITCVDKTPPKSPAITPSSSGWTKEPVEITISGGSDSQSGVARLEYRIGGEGVWTEYTSKLVVTSQTVIYARTVDKVGNVSEPSSLDVNYFDFAAPDVSSLTVTFSSADKPAVVDSGAFGQYYSSAVTVAISGAVDAGSGLMEYQYQFVSASNSLADDKWKKYDPSNKPTVTADFGGYVYARAIDMVNNTSGAVASTGFVVDLTPPVISNIKLSETALTGNRVVVTFTVTDNFLIETVVVNDTYAGVHLPSFTAFRNGDYKIVASDKAGNTAEQTVKISNINATPFTLLNTFDGLNPQDFTPASWANAMLAASDLRALITVESSAALIEAASENLINALEALVSRGDSTLSLELIERVEQYNSELYTESSWALLMEKLDALKETLDSTERTQETIDVARRALEKAVSELVTKGDFTALDRLIAQCERLEAGKYDPQKYVEFVKVLESVKSIPRNDSSQEAIDRAYGLLLETMNSLKDTEGEGAVDVAPVIFVVLGVLIIAVAAALFIIKLRSGLMEYTPDGEEPEDAEDAEDSDSPIAEDIGDFHIEDETTPESQPDKTGSYIGKK